MSDRIALSFNVSGRVQGVWFRAWTKAAAEDLGLCGWVRNRDDGTVSGHLEGRQDAVREMVRRLGSGPDKARVDRVETANAAVEGLGRFEVRR